MGTHFDRGQALFALQRYAEALVEYQNELGVYPQSVASHANIAACLVNLGRKTEAREATSRALELSPDYAHAHYVLSYIEAAPAVAERSIREAIRIEPSPRHFCRLGELLRHAGRHRDCLDATEQALKLNASHIDSLVLRARALAALGRSEEAAEVLRSARSISPQDPDVHQALGSITLSSGDPSEALEAFREARRISPVRHHDRDKILAALSRRVWPFRHIDAVVRRWRRISWGKRWLAAAVGATALLAVLIATDSRLDKPSPFACFVYVVVGNALFFLVTSRQCAAVIVRFAARRELDLRLGHALGANVRAVLGLVLAYLVANGIATMMSCAPKMTFFVLSVAFAAPPLVAMSKKLNRDAEMGIACAAVVGVIWLSVEFGELLADGRVWPAMVWWGVVLLVTGVMSMLFPTNPRQG